MGSPENGQSDAFKFPNFHFNSNDKQNKKCEKQSFRIFTSNSDLKYGLQADKTIL